VSVGLLCPDARVVVELDSPGQFARADGYRRERHKDQLLQEHGYLVLRFLVEEVEKAPEGAMNAIVRVLARKS
jgi:very-short-patch-repair endonuclease